MKVIDICNETTVNTIVNVIGNNNLKGLKYTVPDFVCDADKEIMNMDVKAIEVKCGTLILHVGNIGFTPII